MPRRSNQPIISLGGKRNLGRSYIPLASFSSKLFHALAEIAQRSGSLNQMPKRSESCNSFFTGNQSPRTATFPGSLLPRTKSRKEDGVGRVFTWIIRAFQSKRTLSFLVLPLLACLLVWGLLRRSGDERGRWSAADRQPWRAEIVVESSPMSLLPSQASHGGLAAASERVDSEPEKTIVSRFEEGSQGITLPGAEKKEQEKVAEHVGEASSDGGNGLPDRGRSREEAGDGVDGSNGETTAGSNGKIGKEESDGGKEESMSEGNQEGNDGLKVETDRLWNEEGKEKVQLDVPADCDLYHGSWQPDSEPPLYTNSTCGAISQHQNCQGNGRPDSGYERWRWRPGGREECGALPRFDAVEFMHVMRGKSVLFVGDSVARNHMESLICLLSQVEAPHLRGNKNLIRMVFPRAKLTIARIWSAWLVHESPDPPPSALPSAPAKLPRLQLEKTGEKWYGDVGRYDVVVLCTGHWFVTPALFVVGGRVVGSQGGWWEAHGKEMAGGGEHTEEWRKGEGGGDGGSGEGSGSEAIGGQQERQGGESGGKEQQGEQRRRLEGRVAIEDSQSPVTDSSGGMQDIQKDSQKDVQNDIQKNIQKDIPKDIQVPLNNTAAFSIAIRTVFADVAAAVKANPKQLFVFRTYSPDHYEGGQWNTGGSCAGLTEPRGSNYTYENSYGNTVYNEQKAAYNEAIKELGGEDYKWRFSLMDIMPSAGVRVDGHPGPYRGLNSTAELEKHRKKHPDSKYPPPQDCLHWCLPGPIDSWNVFLLQLIKRHRVVGQAGV
ncbi:unnamed protein product [Closterium sp. Yama58-4]|nr:unnamed protein product [Closterium sp. Yama58-4]